MTDQANAIRSAFGAVLPPDSALSEVAVRHLGEGNSRDVFPVSDLAAESIAAASCALARYAGAASVDIDRRLASFWFHLTWHALDGSSLTIWDDFSGDYRTRDGWLRIHANLPAHRAAAQQVLNDAVDREHANERVAEWTASDLQDAIVAAGGACAQMMSAQQWAEHAQGRSVADEPLVHWYERGNATLQHHVDPERPLRGLRVLDLTRILAGPVATRFLAAYGADVLRIDPPGWDEGVIPEMTPGKRCATLDLKQSADRDRLVALMRDAHVMVHGYRADALERLNLGDEARAEINPGLIDVRLNAYGWTGPWRERRGFDSLVQMSSGIAHRGMLVAAADKPRPMTVQALDHATGYLMAACVLNALTESRRSGRTWGARLSLAATAEVLKRATSPDAIFGDGFEDKTEDDLNSAIEVTAWGEARRLKFPMRIDSVEARWESPACPLHSASADWLAQ